MIRTRAILLVSLLAAHTATVAQLRPSQPDNPTGSRAQQLARAKQHMIAAGHPLAVEAGLRMLDRGGSAIDAMVATQLVLNQGTELESVQATLKAMGHEVRAIPMTSGLQVIRRTRAGWEGGSDPRREGIARGR